MKKSTCLVLIIVGLLTFSKASKGEEMKVLTIRWQRLVDEMGNTCERCNSTGDNVKKAYNILQESLMPLTIEVKLEEKVLDPDACAKDILESNRVWINDRPLEEWLNTNAGKSPCDFCCDKFGDDIECRTIIMKENNYEDIPVELLLKACLLAASELINIESQSSCCESNNEQSPPGPCCPQNKCCPKEQ